MLAVVDSNAVNAQTGKVCPGVPSQFRPLHNITHVRFEKLHPSRAKAIAAILTDRTRDIWDRIGLTAETSMTEVFAKKVALEEKRVLWWQSCFRQDESIELDAVSQRGQVSLEFKFTINPVVACTESKRQLLAARDVLLTANISSRARGVGIIIDYGELLDIPPSVEFSTMNRALQLIAHSNNSFDSCVIRYSEIEPLLRQTRYYGLLAPKVLKGIHSRHRRE